MIGYNLKVIWEISVEKTSGEYWEMANHTLGPLEVIPLDAPLGAEIRGIDLWQGVTDNQLAAIKEAWPKS